MNNISIVLISDNPLIGDETVRLLASCRQNRLIGHLVYDPDTVRIAAELGPDVVVLTGTSTSEAAQAASTLQQLSPEIRVIRQSEGNFSGVSRTLVRSVSAAVARREETVSASGPCGVQLTPREYEVLRYVAEALTNQQIASQFGVSVGTIKRHLHSVFRKLGAVSRLDAVTRGRDAGILAVPTPAGHRERLTSRRRPLHGRSCAVG